MTSTVLEPERVTAKEPARQWVNRWTLKGGARWSDMCCGCGRDHRVPGTPDIVIDSCMVFPSKELAEECATRIVAIRPNVVHLGAEPLAL